MFSVTYLPNDSFKIDVLDEEWEFIEYASKKVVNLNDFDRARMTDIDGVYAFGENIKSEFFDFRLVPNTKTGKVAKTGDRFRFIFRNPSEMVTNYMNGLVIGFGRGLQRNRWLSWIGARKGPDLFNEYGKAFLQYDLEVENRISKSTLNS